MTEAEGPASDETPTDGEPERPVVGWLATVKLEGNPDDITVVLDGREGNTVFLRQADPLDGEEPPRTPIYDGDQIVVMQVIAAVGHHTSPDVGRTDDFLFGTRVVPVRREPGQVYARTLRRGEVDDGTRVHLRPGDQLTFEEGSLVAELDAIDDLEKEASSGGLTPLTPALWTWLALRGLDDDRSRYLLAAARRLDAAAQLFGQVEALRFAILDPEVEGPALRRLSFELIGSVELAVVGLGRVVDMAAQASDLLGTTVALPPLVASKQEALTKIRNAYEHIEDRAVGRVNKRPHPDALTIFNHQRLVEDDVIEYATYALDLVTEVPALLAAIRDFLKDVAGNA